MRDSYSGEPDAVDPPVRFGGRGEVYPSHRPYPLTDRKNRTLTEFAILQEWRFEW